LIDEPFDNRVRLPEQDERTNLGRFEPQRRVEDRAAQHRIERAALRVLLPVAVRSAPQRIGVDGALRSHGYALAIGQDRAGAGKELAVPARRLAAVGPDEDGVTVDDDPDRHAVRHPFRRAGLDVDFAGAVQECKRRARKAQAAPGSGGPAIATAERSGGRNERAVSTTWSRVTARSSLG